MLIGLDAIYLTLKKWQQENDNLVDLFDTSEAKYYIVYDARNERFHVELTYSLITFNEVYFSDNEVAKRCIKDNLGVLNHLIDTSKNK